MLVQSGVAASSRWIRPKGLRPRTNRGYLLWVQPYILVHQAIRERRHALLLDFLANVEEAVVRLFGVFLRFPIFKIHVPAAFVYVVGYHPGQGGQMAVPGPMRLG